MNQLRVFEKPLGHIQPYARNAKTHPKEQVDRIAKQISEVGFLVPIILDRDGVIIAGHGRYLAAVALGLPTVPVVIAEHLTEAQATAFRIADNKVAESAWDYPLLAFELGTLERMEADLTLTGMDMDEARRVLASINGSDPGSPGGAPAEKAGSTEMPEGSFQDFKHTCPRCGFGFDDAAKTS
jgi:ParB-like chromosome segregation protein Spo0J